MNIKKLIAIAVLILALFSCLSVASAGWFDFLGGSEPANETYNFTVCSFDFPENANISNYTDEETGYKDEIFTVRYGTEEDGNKGFVTITISSGTNIADSISETIDNWEDNGGVYEGTYGDWSIINIDNVKIFRGSDQTYEGYILAKHTGNYVVSIEGTNLTELKKIADTYKPLYIVN